MRPLFLALVLSLHHVRGNPEDEHPLRQQRRFDAHLRDGHSVIIQYFKDTSGDIEEGFAEDDGNAYDDDDDDLEVGDLKEHLSSLLGLVPQLWPNYTAPAERPAEEVSCDEARLKCVFRAGCGVALQNYVVECGDLTSGKSNACDAHCRNALTALMSTPEGHRLMKVMELFVSDVYPRRLPRS
jgi:hypothetical protein